jgi:hypothetical protein
LKKSICIESQNIGLLTHRPVAAEFRRDRENGTHDR